MAVPLGRVLPVKVEPIEAPLRDKVVHTVHQHGARGRIADHLRVQGRALVPAAHRDQRLQGGALLLQLHEAAQGAALDLVPVVQDTHGAVAVQADERVGDVRAAVDVDVLDVEATVAGAIGGPAAEVAEDFVCRIGRESAGAGGEDAWLLIRIVPKVFVCVQLPVAASDTASAASRPRTTRRPRIVLVCLALAYDRFNR